MPLNPVNAYSFSINPYVLKAGTIPERLANYYSPDFPKQRLEWQSALENFARLREEFPEVYLELGSGSGRHLLACAERKPQALHIGIEWRYKRAFRTAEKGMRQGLENFYVLRGDFQVLLKELFPPNSLSGVYMHFPDPWEKKKWKKHRPIAREFFETLAQALKHGGFFAVKTDHEEYFCSLREFVTGDEVISKLFQVQKISEDLYHSEHIAENIASEFEQLFLSKKLPIFFLQLVRCEHQPA